MLHRPLTLLLLVPLQSFAWGDIGHQAICQIALDMLNKRALSEVQRLIDLDSGSRDFPRSCTYADHPRQRALGHFVNVPRSTRAITTGECPMADDCLFRAIEDDTSVLEDDNATDEDKLLALKLLAHWIGDIHQPFHVSYQDDRGGNYIEEAGDPDRINLHAAWDIHIIHQRIGTDYKVIAAALGNDISRQDATGWQFDSAVEWANESYQVVTQPDVQYCFLQQGACWYATDNMMLQRGEPRRLVSVDRAYRALHAPTIELRLKQAAVRLAAVLNRVFD